MTNSTPLARNLVLTIVSFTLALQCPPSLRGAEDAPREKTPQELQAAADAGDVEAQFLLGKAYWHGKQVPKDQKKAVDYYRRAAEKNHPDALAGLGAAYGLGQGVEKDERASVEYFRKAAELGSFIGLFNLGNALIVGRGVEKNVQEGLQWLTKAAERGFPKAQMLLGDLLITGEYGVPIDQNQASKWAYKASEQGHPVALNLYGIMLRDGLGVPSDPVAALEYFRRAADASSLKAYLNLGFAYFYGQGVKEDRIAGMSWWYAGEQLGDGVCSETARRMIAGINLEDVQKARELGMAMAREKAPAFIKAKAKAIKESSL